MELNHIDVSLIGDPLPRRGLLVPTQWMLIKNEDCTKRAPI